MDEQEAFERVTDLCGQKLTAEAHTFLDDLPEAFPTADLWLLRAIVRYEEMDRPGVREAADQARLHAAGDAEALSKTSMLLSGLDDSVAAALCAIEAVAADPGLWRGHVALAMAELELSHWPLAAASAREGVRLAPEQELTHFVLGQILLAMNERKEAIASFERALEIDPDYETAKQELRRARSLWRRAVGLVAGGGWLLVLHLTTEWLLLGVILVGLAFTVWHWRARGDGIGGTLDARRTLWRASVERRGGWPAIGDSFILMAMLLSFGTAILPAGLSDGLPVSSWALWATVIGPVALVGLGIVGANWAWGQGSASLLWWSAGLLRVAFTVTFLLIGAELGLALTGVRGTTLWTAVFIVHAAWALPGCLVLMYLGTRRHKASHA